MAGILGSVRALGLVAIVAVMLWFSGVAEAADPCNEKCFKDCTSHPSCAYSPHCIATCGITCGLQGSCKHVSRKVLRNSAKPEEAMKIRNNVIEKHSVGALEGNPCYAECVKDCLNSCSFLGCAACPAICGTHDTCKRMKTIEINSAEGKETVAIQDNAIEKHSVAALEGNPCYAECVKDCLIHCSFSIFCEVCPVDCAGRDTCKDLKNIEINSGKETVAIQNNAIEKHSVAALEGNPCYAECVKDCLIHCGFTIFCEVCPVDCAGHDTCKDLKNIEINNSGNPEDVGKGNVGVEALKHSLRLNSVADE